MENLAEDGDDIAIMMRRWDRVSVAVYITRKKLYNGKINLCARANQRMGFLCSRSLPNPSSTLTVTDMREFLIKIQLTIDRYTECQYCLYPTKNTSSICTSCMPYTYSLVREECIVCLTSDHPIKFKCNTCVDSNVCLKCCCDPHFMDICPLCKKPEKKFGKCVKKRKTYGSDTEEIEDSSDSS